MTTGCWPEDVPMTCPLCGMTGYSLGCEAGSADSHREAKGKSFGLIVRGTVASWRVRADPVDRGGAQPRDHPAQRAQECSLHIGQGGKVNFSKVLIHLSTKHKTLITDRHGTEELWRVSRLRWTLLAPQRCCRPSGRSQRVGGEVLGRAGRGGDWGTSIGTPHHSVLGRFLTAAFSSLSPTGCITLALWCPCSWAA